MSVTFRPTGRTRLLMLLVLIAGVVGAAVLWWAMTLRPSRAPAAAQRPLSAAVQRALTQLQQRTGRPMQLVYAAEQPGGIVCGYAGFAQEVGGRRRPMSAAPFVSFPQRVVIAADDRPGFGRLLRDHCPNFPGSSAA